MKFLIIGLGSMGKRRIRNLLFHKIPRQNIFGFDISAKRTADVINLFHIHSFSTFSQALKEVSPDVYIISTPPHLHSQYFLHAAKNRKHFFSEISTFSTGYKKLLKLLDSSFVAAPSCTWRYYEPIKQIHNLLTQEKFGKILAFTYHMGQYLPDWHPWEDYRQVYFSKPASSAIKEMIIFESIWLQWLLGSEFKLIKGIKGKISELDMKAEDFSSALVETKSGIQGNVVIDVISRYPYRTLRILGSDGVIHWEWLSNKIEVFSSKTKKWHSIEFPADKKTPGYITTESMYEEEIKVFLDAVSGKRRYPYTFAEDLRTLNLLQKYAKIPL